MQGFDPSGFQISEADRARLDRLHASLSKDAAHHLGFPANTLYDYAELSRFLGFTINNAGDPFADGIYKITTHALEREVVSFFAEEMFHAPEGGYWGYVTSGGTEANMYALYLARESYPGGIAYFSRAAHYKVPKLLRLCGMDHITIAAQEDGEMDYEDLEARILEAPDRPPIIIATIGTTMTGAVDDVEKITALLERNGIKDFYIHSDAALGGMILPFMPDAPCFDFSLPIGSVSVSGHKMIGSPIPCGLVIVRKEHVDRIREHVEVIGSHDATLLGSRNGHAALFLWYAMRRFGKSGFEQMIGSCLSTKRYALDKLASIRWPTQATPFSVTIVIKRPSEALVRKWQLAVDGDIAHLIVMPNVTISQIDEFVADLQKEA